MKRIDRLLSDYASYHQTQGNIVTHFFGIPLIMFGLISMLHAVSFDFTVITADELLIAAALLYYLTLDLKLAGLMLIVVVILDFMAWWADSFWIGFILFIIGWIFQGVGHSFYEKKKPAFFKNLTHLLTGPLFLLNEVFQIRKIR